LIVAVVTGFAQAVGSFSSMMDIVSGLALSFMAFILPAVMRFHLSYKKDESYRWWIIVIDFFLFLFGLVAMFTTTYMAVLGVLSGNFGVNTTCWNPATWDKCH
jgi:amino acid permease